MLRRDIGESDSLEDELLSVVYRRGIDIVPLDSTLQELVKIDRKDLEASQVQGAQDARCLSKKLEGSGPRHHFSAACSRVFGPRASVI